MSVDLPEPDGPMTAVNWPAGTLERDAAQGVDGGFSVAVSARERVGGDGGRNGRGFQGHDGHRVVLFRWCQAAAEAAMRSTATAERAGVQQGGGGLLGHAAEQAAARADGDRGADLAPSAGGAGLVGDVERDGAVRGERQAAVAGLVDLDVEAHAAADQPAGDAHARAGREPAAGLVVEVELHRRPAPAGIRVAEHVEHDRRVGVDVRIGRPCPHGCRRSRLRRRLSSAAVSIVRSRQV